jgi:hypothetical protein
VQYICPGCHSGPGSLGTVLYVDSFSGLGNLSSLGILSDPYSLSIPTFFVGTGSLSSLDSLGGPGNLSSSGNLGGRGSLKIFPVVLLHSSRNLCSTAIPSV